MTQRGRHAARNARIPGRRASHERNRTKTKTGRSCQTASRKTVLNQRFSTRLIGWKDEFGLELCIARADDVGRAQNRDRGIGRTPVDADGIQAAAHDDWGKRSSSVLGVVSRWRRWRRWRAEVSRRDSEDGTRIARGMPAATAAAAGLRAARRIAIRRRRHAVQGSLRFSAGNVPSRHRATVGAVSIVVAVVRKHDATYNRDVMRNNNRLTAHVKATAHPKLA